MRKVIYAIAHIPDSYLRAEESIFDAVTPVVYGNGNLRDRRVLIIAVIFFS